MGDAKHGDVIARSRDDLKAARQTGVCHATRYREHRTAAVEIEQCGHRCIRIREALAVDNNLVLLPVLGRDFGR